MKAFALYFLSGCIVINVAANITTQSIKGLQRAQQNRIEKLCAVNPSYCP